MFLTTVSFLALLVGLFLVWKNPIHKIFSTTTAIDNSIGSLLIIVFILRLTSLYLASVSLEEMANFPCGQNTPQAKCYRLDATVCKTAWSQSELNCKSELAEVIKEKGPGALIGPMIRRCQAAKLDRMFKSLRANTDSFYCSTYFEELIKE